MEVESDAEVIIASLGEPARFGVIFDRHASVLHRYVIRRLGPVDADSLVGDIFRIAFERRHTFDPTRPTARPWLYGIATNLIARSRRSEARRLRAIAALASQRPSVPDMAEAISDAMDATNRWHAVVRAVTELPTGERDAVLLHVWEGLSYDDIAQALSIPVGTVRSRLNRARRRLREPTGSTGEQQTNTSDASGRIGA